MSSWVAELPFRKVLSAECPWRVFQGEEGGARGEGGGGAQGEEGGAHRDAQGAER